MNRISTLTQARANARALALTKAVAYLVIAAVPVAPTPKEKRLAPRYFFMSATESEPRSMLFNADYTFKTAEVWLPTGERVDGEAAPIFASHIRSEYLRGTVGVLA